MKNHIIYISPQTPYLEKFWFSSYGPKCCQAIRLQDSLKYNISYNHNSLKCIIHEDKYLSFLEADTIVFEFSISLQCLKKQGRDEVDFCKQINSKFF